VCALVRWHMQVLFVAHHLPFAELPAMLRSVDPNEIALLVFCDRLGRGEKILKDIEKEEKNIGMFLSRCAQARKHQ